jgi:hypothetical protein
MANANSIQQELYQAEYDIDGTGPNNFNLAVDLTYPGGEGHIQVAHFGAMVDGQSSWIPVCLTGLKSSGNGKSNLTYRKAWEFEGILWSRELHAKKLEGGVTIKARVKGIYDSDARTGKLYVFAHEQPKPIVEMISWEEMYRRISQAIDEGRRIVLERKYRSYAIYRERPTRIEYFDGKFRFTSPQTYCMQNATEWSPIVSGGVIIIQVAQVTSLPFAFGDGRILFTTGNGVSTCDITIYMPDEGVTCP